MAARGPKPQHVVLSPRARELLDGLLLGHAWLVKGKESAVLYVARHRAHEGHLDFVEAALSRAGLTVRHTRTGTSTLLRVRATYELATQYGRWYPADQKRVPADVQLGPDALAVWFASAGARISNGYAARLTLVGMAEVDAQRVAEGLRDRYNWRPIVEQNRIRLARSGDRLALQRAITMLVPPAVRPRLVFRESQPTTESEASRRRAPRVLGASEHAALQARIEAGEPYVVIAADLGVSAQRIGRLARALGVRRRPGTGGGTSSGIL